MMLKSEAEDSGIKAGIRMGALNAELEEAKGKIIKLEVENHNLLIAISQERMKHLKELNAVRDELESVKKEKGEK